MNPGEEWITYRRADGDMIAGEYAFVTDTDGWFDEDFDQTELVEETWVLKSTRSVTVGPTCGMCDEAPTFWGLCEAHAREDDPEHFAELDAAKDAAK